MELTPRNRNFQAKVYLWDEGRHRNLIVPQENKVLKQARWMTTPRKQNNHLGIWHLNPSFGELPAGFYICISWLSLAGKDHLHNCADSEKPVCKTSRNAEISQVTENQKSRTKTLGLQNAVGASNICVIEKVKGRPGLRRDDKKGEDWNKFNPWL